MLDRVPFGSKLDWKAKQFCSSRQLRVHTLLVHSSMVWLVLVWQSWIVEQNKCVIRSHQLRQVVPHNAHTVVNLVMLWWSSPTHPVWYYHPSGARSMRTPSKSWKLSWLKRQWNVQQGSASQFVLHSCVNDYAFTIITRQTHIDLPLRKKIFHLIKSALFLD